jgi:ribosome-binding ATPase YchF (GTP1/OBG family)
LELIRDHLEKGKGLRELVLSEKDDKLIRSFAFLSKKPLLHMINLDEKDIPIIETPEKIYHAPSKGTAVLAFCGKIESEILSLDEGEKGMFLEEYGLHQLSSPKFLKASYDLLDVITFFTIGKQEVKAWTIQNNSSASSAAGAIHTDMEKGFIRAEVISWSKLLEFASLQEAKENGAVRLEGKEYIVRDGDVIYFRFSK